MNQTRSFLLIAWLAVAALLWIEWNKPAPAPANTNANATTAAPGAPGAAAVVDGATLAPVGALPGAPASTSGAALAPAVSANAAASSGAPDLITLESDTLQLDFCVRIDGIRTYESLRSRASSVYFGKKQLLVASMADIIKSKRAAGRPQDLAILVTLEDTYAKIQALEKEKASQPKSAI